MIAARSPKLSFGSKDLWLGFATKPNTLSNNLSTQSEQVI